MSGLEVTFTSKMFDLPSGNSSVSTEIEQSI